jgi:hypothetical protein
MLEEENRYSERGKGSKNFGLTEWKVSRRSHPADAPNINPPSRTVRNLEVRLGCLLDGPFILAI